MVKIKETQELIPKTVKEMQMKKIHLDLIAIMTKLNPSLIIFLVMIIASFSMVGALVMLIIDKRENIKTIITMGADVDFVRRIFVNEGMIIGMTGAAAGLVLGVVISMLQEHFGFVKINAQSFLVDAYPVVLQWGDVLGVAVAVIAVNFIITTFTVAKMVPKSTITL